MGTKGMEWVIDADAHVTEPPEVWQERVPSKFKEMAPRMVRGEDGVDRWYVAGVQTRLSVGATAPAGWTEPLPSLPRNMDEIPRAAWDAKERLAYMDSIGLWAQVMYPNVGGFGNQAFLQLGDPELMLACVQAYNDWLLDWCSHDSKRLIPIMAMPFWDVDASVRELERCAELGHRGVLFTGEPQRFGLPVLGHEHWNPLWSAAQDAALSISFHIGSGDFSVHLTPERIEAHGYPATAARSGLALFFENGTQVADLLLSGVLPRYPDLKFVSVESGIGWVPFALEALDFAFDHFQVRRDRPQFELLPSEYFRRQVYGCYFFEEFAPQRMLDVIGADNFLFETDYPHPTCLYGDVRERIEASVKGHPDAVRHKLLWANAANLYRIEKPSEATAGA